MSDANNQTGDGPDGDDLIAAEYVLGVLDAEQRRAVAGRAAREPALAARIAAWEERLAPFNEGYAEITPPAAILDRIEDRIGRSGVSPAVSWWNSLAFWRGMTVATLAVAVIAVGFALFGRTGVTPPPDMPQLVATLEAEQGPTRVVALYEPAAGTLRISPVRVDPTEGKDFELWLIEGGNDPISLGVVSQEISHSIPVPENLQPRLHAGTVLAITLEPPGGTPTGVATGPVVAVGEAAQI